MIRATSAHECGSRAQGWTSAANFEAVLPTLILFVDQSLQRELLSAEFLLGADVRSTNRKQVMPRSVRWLLSATISPTENPSARKQLPMWKRLSGIAAERSRSARSTHSTSDGTSMVSVLRTASLTRPAVGGGPSHRFVASASSALRDGSVSSRARTSVRSWCSSRRARARAGGAWGGEEQAQEVAEVGPWLDVVHAATREDRGEDGVGACAVVAGDEWQVLRSRRSPRVSEDRRAALFGDPR